MRGGTVIDHCLVVEKKVGGASTLLQVSLSLRNMEKVLPYLLNLQEKQNFYSNSLDFKMCAAIFRLKHRLCQHSGPYQTKAQPATPVPCPAAQKSECLRTLAPRPAGVGRQRQALCLILEKGNVSQLLKDIKWQWRKSSKDESKNILTLQGKAKFLKSEQIRPWQRNSLRHAPSLSSPCAPELAQGLRRHSERLVGVCKFPLRETSPQPCHPPVIERWLGSEIQTQADPKACLLTQCSLSFLS